LSKKPISGSTGINQTSCKIFTIINSKVKSQKQKVVTVFDFDLCLLVF